MSLLHFFKCFCTLFSLREQTEVEAHQWEQYVSFFGPTPTRYKSITREQFLDVTGFKLLDASRAKNCPPGVSVTVIATETAPTRKVTPRIIVEAVRRNWPVVNYGWMSACVHARSVQPLEQFSINAQDLLLRVKPKLAVSAWCIILCSVLQIHGSSCIFLCKIVRLWFRTSAFVFNGQTKKFAMAMAGDTSIIMSKFCVCGSPSFYCQQ